MPTKETIIGITVAKKEIEMVTLSYYNSDGIHVPTTTTELVFYNMSEMAKYCVLMGNIADNREILPIVIDENNRVFEVTHELINEYYQG